MKAVLSNQHPACRTFYLSWECVPRLRKPPGRGLGTAKDLLRRLTKVCGQQGRQGREHKVVWTKTVGRHWVPFSAGTTSLLVGLQNTLQQQVHGAAPLLTTPACSGTWQTDSNVCGCEDETPCSTRRLFQVCRSVTGCKHSCT